MSGGGIGHRATEMDDASPAQVELRTCFSDVLWDQLAQDIIHWSVREDILTQLNFFIILCGCICQ